MRIVRCCVPALALLLGACSKAPPPTPTTRMARDSGLMSQASFMATNMADKLRGNINADEDAWNKEVEQVLPNGSGKVDGADDIRTITVTWTESADSITASESNERTYTLAVRL